MAGNGQQVVFIAQNGMNSSNNPQGKLLGIEMYTLSQYFLPKYFSPFI